MRFLLDTDTISFALRGEGRVADELRRRSPSEVCTSSIVVGELELGVSRRGSRKLRRELEGVYAGLQVLAYDMEAARRYGRLAASLLDRGVPIGVEDTMVAAHALARKLTLVTHKTRHFDRVAGLRVEDWF
ncbi:MAG: type II toxin-antitoxin system VapC family toxin [Myxococcota bacterium]|nr:type II toxin-antitoxin system VapC family toxin [Myxococcota bacterium]